MNNCYVLYDCPLENNDKQWLSTELKANGDMEVKEFGICPSVFRMQCSGKVGILKAHAKIIVQSLKVVMAVKKNDTIVAWNPLAGLYTNFLLILFCKKTKIISMNWLSCKRIANSHCFRFLHKKILNNKNAYLTVNVKQSAQEYINVYKAGNLSRFIYIPDVPDMRYEFEITEYTRGGYIFIGGANNRNWRLVVDIAKELPDLKFVCIALKEDWEIKVNEVPDNIEVYFDTTAEFYYKKMKNALVVLMPLCDEKVAGLINIIKAAQYGKICVCSRTPATEQYYIETPEYLLDNVLDDWVRVIGYIYGLSEEVYKNEVKKFAGYIEKTFSPENAIKHLIEVMEA